MADSCWPGYVADGKKKSPSGKKTKSGAIKMVNNCVKRGSISQLRQEATGLKLSDYSSVVSNVNDVSGDAINLVGPKTSSQPIEEDSGMSRRELRRDRRKQNKKNRSGASSRPAF
tara:strand:+ start:141 stop:485 length:345 start_codon:yes stop_codon:yes gene_type:complete